MIKLSTGLISLVMGPDGKSYADALKQGLIRFYTGPQPASANDIETGALLCEVSNNGAIVTPGWMTNGLTMVANSAGRLDKDPAETWKGQAITTGVCGWFRFYDNNGFVGASTNFVRLDGSVAALSGGDITMSHTDIAAGDDVSIELFYLVHPLL